MAVLPSPVTLISAGDLARRVAELAGDIRRDLGHAPLTALIVANGAFVFAADLLRQLDWPMEIDVIKLASYEGTRSSGVVRCLGELRVTVAGRRVLVIDDILDTGHTLAHLADDLSRRGALGVHLCVLLRKQRPEPPLARADYVGFTIPDEFVVGYGLDYRHLYRNLPYVGILSPAALAPAPAVD